jgi:hypothetical protein
MMRLTVQHFQRVKNIVDQNEIPVIQAAERWAIWHRTCVRCPGCQKSSLVVGRHSPISDNVLRSHGLFGSLI